jgi:hypothetical protein
MNVVITFLLVVHFAKEICKTKIDCSKTLNSIYACRFFVCRVCQAKGRLCPSGNNADELLWWPCPELLTTTPMPAMATTTSGAALGRACRIGSIAFGLGLFPPPADANIVSTIGDRVFSIDVRDVERRPAAAIALDWRFVALVPLGLDQHYVALNDPTLFALGDVKSIPNQPGELVYFLRFSSYGCC